MKLYVITLTYIAKIAGVFFNAPLLCRAYNTHKVNCGETVRQNCPDFWYLQPFIGFCCSHPRSDGVQAECMSACDSNPCINGAQCEELWQDYRCLCANPFSQSGRNCQNGQICQLIVQSECVCSRSHSVVSTYSLTRLESVPLFIGIWKFWRIFWSLSIHIFSQMKRPKTNPFSLRLMKKAS